MFLCVQLESSAGFRESFFRDTEDLWVTSDDVSSLLGVPFFHEATIL